MKSVLMDVPILGAGWIWSGSAVVDWRNSAGFQTGKEKALVAFYTTGGFGKPRNPIVQAVAFSNDRGRTWTKYRGNPVIGNVRGDNRDPKVIWHVPSQQWVMALYLDGLPIPEPCRAIYPASFPGNEVCIRFCSQSGFLGCEGGRCGRERHSGAES